MFDPNTKAQSGSAESQTMSPQEVEQLLAIANNGSSAASGAESSPHGSDKDQKQVARYGFPTLSAFSVEDMRKLRIRCDTFIRTLSSRLSAHLSMECAMQLTNLEAVRYDKFTAALPTPTHLTLFRLEPLSAICLLNISPRLALTFVDRELGGPGVCGEEIRELTQIDSQLAAKVISVVLGQWCAVWGDILQLRLVHIRHETSTAFLQTSSTATMMLSLGMEIRIAQTVEPILIAFPKSVLEPLLLKLNSSLKHIESPDANQLEAAVHWNPALDEVPVRITARWHGTELTARQLMGLNVGDVIPLKSDAESQVQLSLDASPKFAGHMGTSGKQLAIKILKAL